MGLKDFFSNRTETQDHHRISELQTRYYKATRSKVMETVKGILDRQPNVKVLDFLEEHGEITAELIKPRKAFLVVSVVTVFPYRTAIDLTITTNTLLLPIDWGYSRRTAIQLYEKFDKELEFVGVGLSENQ